MAQYLDEELQHSDYFLITHGKEYQSLSMIYDLTISMMTTWSPDWGQSDFQYWVDITQHFGMELHSTSDPHSSRIFKTLTYNQSTLSSQRSSSHSPHLTALDYNAEPLLLQVLLRRSF